MECAGWEPSPVPFETISRSLREPLRFHGVALMERRSRESPPLWWCLARVALQR
ncbi:hypothetical protein [Azospirillum largimobile]